MKKKTLKKALSLALSLAMVVSSITVSNLETKAAELEEIQTWVADADYNLALNKVTTVYPGVAEGSQVNLNNGALGAGGAHCALSSAWGYLNESYATIDLGDFYDASTLDMVIIQYKDAADNDTVVGRSYKIQYSADGVSFYDAIAETNVYKAPEEGEALGLTLDANRMTIDDVSSVEGTVRYVRAYYPTTPTYGIQITEIAVLAEAPETVEVEKCEDAAGVEVEVTDYNTFEYTITAGEGQEDYVYMVYLNGTRLIGDKVSAGVAYEMTGIAADTYTLKVVSVYDGKVSEGIVSEAFTVDDVSVLITDVKNIANVNNNSAAKVIEVSDMYVDDNGTYTLEAAQVALDGLYPTGEAATQAIRTAPGVAPVTVVVDLGEYYRAVEIDKILLAHSNPRTYVGTVAVELSEDNETYTEVGSKSGYTCAVDNGPRADVNVVELDEDKLNDYTDAVRYVRLTLSDGSNGWGYVVNEIGVVMTTDTPVTGLAPKLNDIAINTEVANTIDISVAATTGFEDALYEALLLDENENLIGSADLTLEDGYFTGAITDVAKGNYDVKIRVTYSEGTKTIDKIVEDVSVDNPKISAVTATSEEANNIVVTWEVTGYYGDQAYNVYLDGELVAEKVKCAQGEESYTITEIPAGEYSVAVSLVVGEDESEIISSEAVTVYPVAIEVDEVLVNALANKVYVAWEHELLDGEVAEYTVSLKDTDKSATVERNEEGYFQYSFDELSIGIYTVVVTVVVNGITLTTECEAIKTTIDYAVEPNTFKLFLYSEEPYSTFEDVISFNDEEVIVTLEDLTYDEETKLYTYEKKLGKGTYTVMLVDEAELCTVDVVDVEASPVTNFTSAKNDKNVDLTWDVAEGHTYSVYVNRVLKAEGITEGKYTVENVEPGSYFITVEATYVNPYSSEPYVVSADTEITIEEETTTQEPTTQAPGTEETTTVKDPSGNNQETTVDPATMKRPGKVKVKKATKKVSAKKLSLKISKVNGATSYEVAVYKTKKNAKKNKKAIATTTSAKVKIVVKGKKLKGVKKLFVRVRAVNAAGTGKWSKVKKVTIK